MKTIEMKKLIAIVGLLLMAATASAQLSIPGTKFTFKLNNEDWRYLRTYELPEGGNVYLYCYTGQMLLDAEGDTVLPFLSIYVNKGYEGDLYEFVYERYMAQPYQAADEYSKGPGLPSTGGLGYMGAYTNPKDGKDYQFYMTYFKDRRVMVEFRLETTKDTFKEMDFEFKDILESVK